jgi:hypothetical protein
MLLLWSRPLWPGVSKGVEDSLMPLALCAGYPINGRMAVLGVTYPTGGIEGSGMAGPFENSGSPSIRPSVHLSVRQSVCPSIHPSVHPSICPSVHPSSHEKLLPIHTVL